MTPKSVIPAACSKMRSAHYLSPRREDAEGQEVGRKSSEEETHAPAQETHDVALNRRRVSHGWKRRELKNMYTEMALETKIWH